MYARLHKSAFQKKKIKIGRKLEGEKIIQLLSVF